MSTVFLGTSAFAAAVLERLARDEVHRPAFVITRPDRPRGRGRQPAPPPVAVQARALGIALEQPASVNDAAARALIASAGRRAGRLSPGAGEVTRGARQTVVVCAFGALIKEPLLSEHELLNVHPSLLPRWRGAAPIERAIMAGDERTGVSIMRLTAGLDSGPVYLAGHEQVHLDDTYGSLAARLQRLGAELLLRVLDGKADGRAPEPAEQDERAATYAEKIGPEDRLLDPTRPAAELQRVVRALHPHVGARVALGDGTLLGVRDAMPVDGRLATGDRVHGGGSGGDSRPLGVSAHDGRLLLVCADGVLELVCVQPPGGRAMDGASYLRGHTLPGRR